MIRAFILANDDLTSSIIFAPLFESTIVDIVGVGIAKSPTPKASNHFAAALALSRKMSRRYWAYLVVTHGLYKVFDFLTITTGRDARKGALVSLSALAQRKGIPVARVADFNGNAFRGQLTAARIDLLIIRIGTILSRDVLAIARYGTWCVHSSILPAFKGIAGEFHALRHDAAPVGSTIFVVQPRLDEGNPIRQCCIPRQARGSVYAHMLRNNYAAGTMLRRAVEELSATKNTTVDCLNIAMQPSYFSWPRPHEVAHLRRSGIPLIRFIEAFWLVLTSLRIASGPSFEGK